LIPAAPWRLIVAALADALETTEYHLVRATGLDGSMTRALLGGADFVTPDTDRHLRKLLPLLPTDEGKGRAAHMLGLA
jgi:hypothetical protein